ncbi:ABC transporter substrate-binding protein [Streptomyces solisilvae]|uniref:ABC transporter substrate-binding protein n=1 Tax=Streptomyces malaysiensis TaxID=92644 RepID=UPI00367793AE
MRPTKATIALKVLGLATVLCAGTLAGCSSGSGGPGNGTPSPSFTNTSSGPAKLVPASVRKSGSITIVTNATYPPYGRFAPDGTTIEGLDVDTANAIAPLIALPVKVVNASFDNFIPGLKAGRYDAGFNGITDTTDRRKTVDFINFEKFGNYFLTPTGSNLKITSLLSACGLNVGAENGDESINQYKQIAPQCRAIGKSAPNVKVYPSQAAAISAMVSERVQAILTGSNGPELVRQSNGKYKINGPYLPDSGDKFSVGGLAIAKGSPLAPALLAAMKTLYTNGTLGKIYAKYGFSAANILISPALDTGSGSTPTATRS